MVSTTPLVLYHQQQEVVEFLTQTGLAPSNFVWTAVQSAFRDEGHLASRIQYKSGDYHCQIDRKANGSWVLDFCPGDKQWTDRYESYWEQVTGRIKQWAGYLAREFKAIDYLAVAMNSPQLLELPKAEEENTPFTTEEQEQLVEQLDRIEERLLSYRSELDEFHVEVRKSFQCLRDEVARGGRTAFRYALFGALLSISLAFLTPGETKQIIDFATQQVSRISGLLIQSVSN